jgi:rhamnosyltransferase
LKTKLPKVAILLASYNGENWIVDQIKSILNQINVSIDIFVSIDFSTDNTFQLIKDLQYSNTNINILKYGERFGGAAKNFFRLIKEVDVSKYDFVALSDQDDIWLPDKLYQGVNKLKLMGFDAYSSDVIAFWSDGRKKLIRKSYPQKNYDFMFESAGPGCTYILNTTVIVEFQKFLLDNWLQINQIDLHDWLIYAFCRSNKYKWFIDSNVGLLYRQHDNNQFGANVSIRSYFTRLSLIKNGWYFGEVFKISNLLKLTTPDNLFLFSNLMQLRRKKRDSLMLFFFYFFRKILCAF